MTLAIGVIDSGVGGLTVAHEIMRCLPKEKVIYLGDSLRCPYGPRPEDEVKAFTKEMVAFLMTKHIKLLVIACNTATAFTLKTLQAELPIPVIGVVAPGAKAAVETTRNRYVGVIGTQGTIASGAYNRAIDAHGHAITVASLACPDFVPLVEKGDTHSAQAYAAVQAALIPFVAKHPIDTLILGCTHYPLLQQTISAVLGEHIQLVSSDKEITREVETLLSQLGQLSSARHEPHEFYFTGNIKAFKNTYERIFGANTLLTAEVVVATAVL